LGLCRFLLFLLRSMVTNGATDSGACHPMVPSHMANDAADRCTLDATMRACHAWKRSQNQGTHQR
jgi:hypothetical protein